MTSTNNFWWSYNKHGRTFNEYEFDDYHYNHNRDNMFSNSFTEHEEDTLRQYEDKTIYFLNPNATNIHIITMYNIYSS